MYMARVLGDGRISHFFAQEGFQVKEVFGLRIDRPS